MASRLLRLMCSLSFASGIAVCRAPEDVPQTPAAMVNAVPPWAIPYGREHWRQAGASASPEQVAKGVARVELDLPDLTERVSCAWSTEATGVFVARRHYSARLDSFGLRFAPSRPDLDETAASPHHESDFGLVVATRRATWGTRRLFDSDGAPGARAWTVAGNTAQALLDSSSGLVEHHEARADGVELTWVLARAPEEDGDLTLELGVSGLSFAGTSANGTHWGVQGGVPRVRIGNAVMVDGAGARWNVPTEVVAGGLRLEVPRAVLRAARFPIAIDPFVSPEIGMDAPVLTSAPQNQSVPAISFNGSIYLVVWEDDRAEGDAIYAARVDPSGTVLDPSGIEVVGTAAETPVVASEGSGFLVVWNEPDALQIRGARISASGTLLDPSGLEVAPASPAYASLAVAFGGTHYFLAWQEQSSIEGIRVSPEGVALDTSAIAIGSGDGAAVASDGTNVFVVWRSPAALQGARVDADGVVLDPTGIDVTTTPGSVLAWSVVFNGTDYVVVWRSAMVGARRVSQAGAVLDGADIVVSPQTSSWDDSLAVASNGAETLVAWTALEQSNRLRLKAARINTAGQVLPPSEISVTPTRKFARHPAIASDGVDYLVVWQDALSFQYNISGARVTQAGALADPAGFLVSGAQNEQIGPSVASDGTSFLVVWSDLRRGDAHDIYSLRFQPDGLALDPSGISVSSNTFDNVQSGLAFNGTDYFISWIRRDPPPGLSSARGARLTVQGAVLDPAGISLPSSPYNRPEIASNGTDFFMVWRQLIGTTFDAEIRGARISADGLLLDASSIVIAGSGSMKYGPAVVASGGDYLVAWADDRVGSSGINGARVTAEGVVLDPAGISIASFGSARHPRLTAVGQDTVVAYQDVWSLLVRTAIVEADGTVSGGTNVASGCQIQGRISAVSSGTDVLIAWADVRSQTHADLYAIRVDASGAALPPGQMVLASGLNHAVPLEPELAYSPAAQRYLIAYQEFDETPGVGSTRLRARVVSFDWDGDGLDAASDDDQDNDGADDAAESVTGSDPYDPRSCGDVDGDTCDDCSQNPTSSASPAPWAPFAPDELADGDDEDGDGFCDAGDPCPSDPLKVQPGLCGCGVADDDSDGDGDGAPDCTDGCVSDPDKTEPGVCGCGVGDDDGDADGAPDCTDGCASDPGKTEPGTCGCGVSDADGDVDGTPDCTDGCASDPGKTEPGVCGCGVSDVDGDVDGTPDCLDACANDAAKTAPGVCGCGTSDDDSDGDTSADCMDACASDASKTEPGACGCGVSDADGDGDGVVNCQDGCPGDANKSEAGSCGCGIADTDTDLDTLNDCADPDDDDDFISDEDEATMGTDPLRRDTDGDGLEDSEELVGTDPTDPDSDDDGVLDGADACEGFADDVDADVDGIANGCDQCPQDASDDQDGDGLCAELDNCPGQANADQRDADSDGLGDACDVDDDPDGNGGRPNPAGTGCACEARGSGLQNILWLAAVGLFGLRRLRVTGRRASTVATA